MYDDPPRHRLFQIISALDLGECLIQMTNYLCAKDKTCFRKIWTSQTPILLPICKEQQFHSFFLIYGDLRIKKTHVDSRQYK